MTYAQARKAGWGSCARTLTTMNQPTRTIEIELHSDVLSYYVGQNIILQRLIKRENDAGITSISTIRFLREELDEVRERISELTVEALVTTGIDRDHLIRAELRIGQTDPSAVRIVGIAELVATGH